MKRINVGVIGAGFIAETAHIPNLFNIAEAKLIAISDVNAERLKKIAIKFDLPEKKCYTNFEDLLKNDDVQAVLVCSSTSSHASVSIKASEYGKHSFVEKPIAENSSDADAMIEAADKNRVKLMVGHYMGFLPTHQKARKLMRDGVLGDIFNFEIHAETIVIKPDEGILIDFAPHCVDLLRWYFDDQKIIRTCALIGSFNNPAKKDTTATILFELSNGVIASISTHWVPEYKNWDTVERFVRILGSKGKLTVGFTTPEMTLYKASTFLGRVRGPYRMMPSYVMHKSVPITQTSYRKEIEDFINCIIHDRDPQITGRDGKTVLKIIEAINRSFKERAFVEVEY